MTSQLLGTGATVWMPPQSSTVAADVDWLYYFIYWICVVVFIGVCAAMFWFMWRYRRQPGVEADQRLTHHLPLEITWSAIPLFVVILFFYWGFMDFMNMTVPPADAMKVEVQAQKWSWAYTYPNGAVSKDLHVPPHQPVALLMESSDVLHAFFVPDFRVKQDVVPGRVTSLWFEATQPGAEHRVYCAEYCGGIDGEESQAAVEEPGAEPPAPVEGSGHSFMWSKVVVHETQESFDKWVTDQANPEILYDTTWEVGQHIYNIRCATCHNISGSAKVGPNFGDLAAKWGQERTVRGGTVTVDREYVYESIVNPAVHIAVDGSRDYGNAMPNNFGALLSESNVNAIIDYIEHLRESPK